MLSWIYELYGDAWGPLRLFNSFFFLAATGATAGALGVWLLLPTLSKLLPTDKGRAFAVNAEQSIGKPVSAGVVFVTIFCIASLLFLPIGARAMWVVPFMFAAMIVGYIDDRKGGLSEYQLAVLDLFIALGAAAVICGFEPTQIWIPGWMGVITLEPWLSIPLATGVIWISINATNCSDGVDGVSGSLTATAIIFLGALLYAVIGNAETAGHVRVAFNPEGSSWAIMAFVMAGCIGGYLWYNAAPSQMLMGDSGSRPIGLLIGMLVVATNTPFFIFLIGTVLLANGATGLFKVALLRFFRVKIFTGIRFPLHDHCRKELGWSNTQVLVRFMLVHIGLSALLVVLALKVR